MKKVISIALALLMVAVMLPVMAAAADAEYDITTEADLRGKVSTMAAGDNVTVRLQNDVTVVGKLEVKAGTLTILGQGHTITFSNPNSTMHITGTGIVNLGTKEGEGNDLTLTSDNITDSVVYMAGSAELNMYDGVEIRDSTAAGTVGGVHLEGDKTVFNMYGGVIDKCVGEHVAVGGVLIKGGALFNMYDGVIQNCSGTLGGAVYVSGGPAIGGYISGSSGFHMYGGTIKDCQANWIGGAVCVNTTEPVSFIMDGGTITGCNADGEAGYGYGGAVFISTPHKDAVIKINKGEISGNSGVYGGGIYVEAGNGEIAAGVALHNNTATKEGDDLYNESGRITLGKLPTGLKLKACGCSIDGWYHDNDGARWSSTKCGGGEDRMEKHTETAFTDGRALKAAHGEAPAPPIIIVPEAPEQEAPNPTTGRRDLVGVAVAMAAVSLLGAAAVIRKK